MANGSFMNADIDRAAQLDSRTPLLLFSGDEEAAMMALFLASLAFFVLIGLTPALHRAFARWKSFLARVAESQVAPGLGAAPEGAAPPAEATGTPQLSPYEAMVMRQIARRDRAMPTSEALAAALRVEGRFVREALRSLEQKGLVTSLETFVAGRCFRFSSQGDAYAVAHGLYPFPHRAYRAGMMPGRRTVLDRGLPPVAVEKAVRVRTARDAHP